MRLTRKRNVVLVLLPFALTVTSLYLLHHQIRDYKLWNLQKKVFSKIGLELAEPTTSLETQRAAPQDDTFDFNQRLEQEMQHLPMTYLPLQQNSKRSFKRNCAVLPTVFDLMISNVYWQHLVTTTQRNFYLYSAYHDDRNLTQGRRQIRLLGMVDQIPPPTTYCQFWFEDQTKPKFSPNASTYYHIWHNAWGNGNNGTLHPVLISCQLPPDERSVPVVVSLVENVCDNARNALRIFNDTTLAGSTKERSHDEPSIAVCVKGLNYLHEDRSVRLIEWLELLRILGAEKVFMYKMSVHPNIARVLSHYQREGFVDVRNLTLPGDQVNYDDLRLLYLSRKIVHKRQNELIPYNDCLYRSIRRYDYVVLLDTDEVIVPDNSANTWQQLIRLHTEGDIFLPPEYSSLCALNVHFYDDYLDSDPNEVFAEVPKHLHMLNHIHRMADFSKPGMATKCFHATHRTLTLHNHHAMQCGSRGCRAMNIRKEDGRMQHYRNRNRTGKPNEYYQIYLNQTVLDKTLWRFKDELTRQSNSVLTALGYKIP